jgi:hypothetical protein
MDQQMTIAHLALKRLSGRAIHENLTATLGRGAVEYSSATRYLREIHLLPSSQDAVSADFRRGIDDTDQALLSTLDENPFASVRQVSPLTQIPPMTVYRSLTECLGFTALDLRWVPARHGEDPSSRSVLATAANARSPGRSSMV